MGSACTAPCSGPKLRSATTCRMSTRSSNGNEYRGSRIRDDDALGRVVRCAQAAVWRPAGFKVPEARQARGNSGRRSQRRWQGRFDGRRAMTRGGIVQVIEGLIAQLEAAFGRCRSRFEPCASWSNRRMIRCRSIGGGRSGRRSASLACRPRQRLESETRRSPRLGESLARRGRRRGACCRLASPSAARLSDRLRLRPPRDRQPQPRKRSVRAISSGARHCYRALLRTATAGSPDERRAEWLEGLGESLRQLERLDDSDPR